MFVRNQLPGARWQARVWLRFHFLVVLITLGGKITRLYFSQAIYCESGKHYVYGVADYGYINGHLFIQEIICYRRYSRLLR